MPNVDHFIVNPEKCWLKEQHICAIRFIHKLISIQHLGIQPMAEPNIFKVRHCYIGMFRSLIITHFYNQYRKKKKARGQQLMNTGTTARIWKPQQNGIYRNYPRFPLKKIVPMVKGSHQCMCKLSESYHDSNS